MSHHAARWLSVCAPILGALLIALASNERAAAQTALGKPLIYNFARTAAGAEVQHWDAVQDHRGVVYFANNSGVLEFDGRSWRLIELPSRVAVRYLTVAPDGKGRIYVGAVGDFGYLQPNHTGQLQFVSLLPPAASADASFDQVFMPVIAPSDGSVYFQGKTKRCHFVETVHCGDSGLAPTTLFSAAGTLYVHQATRGLMEFADGSPRPIPGGERFANDEITVVLSVKGAEDEHLLIGTRDFRFFVQRQRSFEPLTIKGLARRSVRAKAGAGSPDPDQLFDGVVLPDGSLAFATLLRGVLIVDQAGNLPRQIDESTGLLDNHVLAVQPDRHSGAWLALQNGVSRIELSPAFSVFDESSGLEREWREAIEHDGMLYVRGYKGLYAASLRQRAPSHAVPLRTLRFERVIDVKPPVWGFISAERRLVVAAQDGIYEVRGTDVRRVITYPSMPLALHRSRHDPRRFYVGLDAGVASLRLEDDGWRDEGRIAELQDTITSIGEEANGDLWLVSQRQRVIRVSIDRDRGAPRVHAYPLGEQALTGRISIHEVAGRAVFLTDRWILEFDASSERFVPFSRMNALMGTDRRSFSWIHEDAQGNLWVASRQPARVDLLRKQGDGRYVLDNARLRQTMAWSIYPEANGGGSIVWFCTPDYLLRYDRTIDTESRAHFSTLLRNVTINDKMIYGGASGAEVADAAFRYGSNALQFEFAAPRFDDAERNEFQSYLEGFDTEWSGWTTASTRVYTNLPKGTYRFQVRARDVHGREGDTATFAFSILPPWYLTGWAYALYGVVACTCLLVISKFERRRAQARLSRRLEHMELEKLRELDRLKSRFFADISHEFRTPLTLILGPVWQMLDEATTPQLVRPLRLIRRHAQYLLRLISQLLDLSKLESRKMRLHATRGNLVHGLEQIVTPFASVAERHGIELVFGLSRRTQALGRAEIYFDSDVLQKILNNLIGNALKFTPSGGGVSVDVQGPQNGFVDIVVADTGVGIPEAELPLVFERFYQVERTRSREGIGIGLALVKELVDLHHGEIHVESQEGKGTTFIIRLRTGKAHLAPDEIVESSAVSALEMHLEPSANLEVEDLEHEASELVEEPEDETTILIVEDHADVRTFLREHLQRHYRVVEAQNGSEGLGKALAALPDLVLSDVVMPQMNGYELCRALKTNERTCHIPVVLLTAKTMREDKLLGLETGADCYLMKPFDALELLVQVRNLISQRRHLRERFGGPVVLKPSEMGVTPMDEVFLTKVLAVVQSNLQDPGFDVERLGREVGLSRSQLHRKLRALTNQPPTLLIRSIRLQRAAELLAHKTGSVAEIAYFVGFNSQAYFAKCFREQFGCSPKEYATAAPAKRA